MMADGTNKTVVITGAAGGIGQVIARKFIGAGFRVVLGDADAAQLDILCAGLNAVDQVAFAVAGDLRSKAHCEALVDAAIEKTGRIDVLVNNAGIITRGDILETSDEDWIRTFEI